MAALMLPIRTRSVFKSRWMALLWAGGILWSAAEFAGGQPRSGAGSNDQAANGQGDAEASDMQAAVNAVAALH